MEVDFIEVTRYSTPVFGALLIGVAVGMYAIGAQIPRECFAFSGGVDGPICSTLAWGDRWAMRSALGGAGMFGLAFAAEAAMDRGWSL